MVTKAKKVNIIFLRELLRCSLETCRDDINGVVSIVLLSGGLFLVVDDDGDDDDGDDDDVVVGEEDEEEEEVDIGGVHG
jgi:hypothetical protein